MLNNVDIKQVLFCGSTKISALRILSSSDIDGLSGALLSQVLFGGQPTLATLALTL